jgi:16S rRNA A1518/A1519 N6-dimethyltransferase RsmA/KsgA/DIM1 with predicted DNA glycosylase/AP lyase activity
VRNNLIAGITRLKPGVAGTAGEAASQALAAAGIRENERAENLHLEDFVRLAEKLK